MKHILKQNNIVVWKVFFLIDWNFHTVGHFFFVEYQSTFQQIWIIRAPQASAGRGNAQIDFDEGLSLGHCYEIVILKLGNLG